MLAEGMKSSTGVYLNIFSESGYDNFGLPYKVDLFIIYPEYMGMDLNYIDVETKVHEILKEFSITNHPSYDRNNLKKVLENALMDYDVQVIIKEFQSLNSIITV